jgi:uncharacterized integral membrane protein
MKIRTLALLIALFLLGLFCALNWQALSAPSALSLGLVQVQAPLGLILLGATVVISGLFLFYIVAQQAHLLMESRRFTKELQAQRQLADQAEASRFTELQTRLEALVTRLEQGTRGPSSVCRPSDEAVRELSAHLAEWKTSWTARWPAWADAPGRTDAGMPFHHTVFLGTPAWHVRAALRRGRPAFPRDAQAASIDARICPNLEWTRSSSSTADPRRLHDDQKRRPAEERCVTLPTPWPSRSAWTMSSCCACRRIRTNSPWPNWTNCASGWTTPCAPTAATTWCWAPAPRIPTKPDPKRWPT